MTKTYLDRIDIMVDIETLGTKADSTIFQISAIAFNIETGTRYYEFNQTADISKNETMNVDGSTIKWWLATNKQLLTDLLNQGCDSSEEILANFHNWILGVQSLVEDTKSVYLWGNGILFDNNMIRTQFQNIGLEYPISYRSDRDVRTIVELACAKTGLTEKELKSAFRTEGLVAHDAFDDVIFQIDLVVGCYKELIPARSPKWYSYRHPETNAELKLERESMELVREGYVLMSVTDYTVDERAMKVGGH